MSAEQTKPAKPSKGAPPQAKKGGKEDKKGAAFQVGERPSLPAGYVPRLRLHYQQHVVPALIKRFQYRNTMEVPHLVKVVVNMGVGEAVGNPRLVETCLKELAAITGQRPCIAKAKKSISNFKLREGMPIGVFVTLRRHQMWEFLDRLIAIAAPRIRDFRGLPDKGFDGRGNYSVGFREQIIFPEVDLDSVEKIRGMDVAIVTSARTDLEAYELLKELGLPMRKRETRGAAAEAA